MTNSASPAAAIQPTLGATPIAGASPVGQSARYGNADFERLQGEMTKLDAVTQPTIDWPEIVRLAAALLEHTTKDLLIGSYLAFALFRTLGFGGLALGLQVMQQMVDTFWETLFPERPTGKAGAVNWLAERVVQALAADAPSPDIAGAEQALAAVASFSDRLAARGPDLRLSLPELRTTLERLLQAARASVQAAKEAEQRQLEEQRQRAAERSVREPPPDRPSAPALIDSKAAAEAWLRDQLAHVATAARVLLKERADDPRPYLLVRSFTWGAMVSLPELSGVDAAFADDLEGRLLRGEHRSVLEDAEARFVSAPLWITINRWVCQAMDGLGQAFAVAKRSVVAATAALLERFPELDTLQSESGPAVDAKTRLWLLTEAGRLDASQPMGDTLTSVLRDARKLAASGQLKEAVARLQREIHGMPHPRSRFGGLLALAQLCLDAGQRQLALTQLEALDQQIAKFALEEWDPPLAFEAVKLLWLCHGGKATDRDERASQLFARLCRLDLSAALALDGQPKQRRGAGA